MLVNSVVCLIGLGPGFFDRERPVCVSRVVLDCVCLHKYNADSSCFCVHVQNEAYMESPGRGTARKLLLHKTRSGREQGSAILPTEHRSFSKNFWKYTIGVSSWAVEFIPVELVKAASLEPVRPVSSPSHRTFLLGSWSHEQRAVLSDRTGAGKYLCFKIQAVPFT